MRVLIVESEPQLGRLMKRWLVEVGYAVCLTADAASAGYAMRAASYDLLLLDGALPPLACHAILQLWRTGGVDRPLLVLGAHEGLPDPAMVSTDQYLAKPFAVDELLAQVGRQLRQHSLAKGLILEYRGIRLNRERHTAIAAGKTHHLGSYEFSLLEIFMLNVGRTLPRAAMSAELWTTDEAARSNVLNVYVSKLRAKFDTDASAPLFRTIPGVGYCLV